MVPQRHLGGEGPRGNEPRHSCGSPASLGRRFLSNCSPQAVLRSTLLLQFPASCSACCPLSPGVLSQKLALLNIQAWGIPCSSQLGLIFGSLQKLSSQGAGPWD